MRQQDAHILNCGDQVILDLLSPESPPMCAFEVVVVSGVGKTCFHPLAPLPRIVLPCAQTSSQRLPCPNAPALSSAEVGSELTIDTAVTLG